MADMEIEKAWYSEGSTLNNTVNERPSRWSFLAWHGHQGAKAKPEVVEDVPEEPKEVDEVSSVEKRPVTQHIMTAYVSSSEESKSSGENMNGHRRTFSADEESLTVPRIYTGGSRAGDSSTGRATEEDYHDIGHAR